MTEKTRLSEEAAEKVFSIRKESFEFHDGSIKVIIYMLFKGNDGHTYQLLRDETGRHNSYMLTDLTEVSMISPDTPDDDGHTGLVLAGVYNTIKDLDRIILSF